MFCSLLLKSFQLLGRKLPSWCRLLILPKLCRRQTHWHVLSENYLLSCDISSIQIFWRGPFRYESDHFVHHWNWPNLSWCWSTHLATLVSPEFHSGFRTTVFETVFRQTQTSVWLLRNSGSTFETMHLHSAQRSLEDVIHSDKTRSTLVSVLKDRAHFDETPAPVWHFPSLSHGRWRGGVELGTAQEMSSAVIKLCLFPLL